MRKIVFTTVTLALLILSLICFSPVKADLSNPNSESWAIIIGVSNYAYLDDLRYCDDDAISLYNQIAPTWGESHVKLLTNTNAKKTNIYTTILNWLAPAEDADDTVLFFFSGHGGQGNDVTPIDETDHLDEYIYPYDSLTSSWANDIRDDEFNQWLNLLDSEKIVVMLDACFSGGFINSMATAKVEISKTATTEAYPKLSSPNDSFGKDLSKSGRVLLAASAESEGSWESPTLKHGVFSYYIIEALSKLEIADTNSNHEISAQEIFNYAEPRTVSFTENFTDPQHPQLYDGYNGELPLIITATVTFDNSPRVASLTVDGTTFSRSQLPMSFTWTANTAHTFNASSVVYENEYMRYAFSSWNDGNTSTSRTLTVTETQTYMATYKTEYYLTINSPYGSSGSEDWYENGTTAYATLNISIVDYLNGTRVTFANWYGNATGSNFTASNPIYMNASKTAIANWKTQYLLSFTVTPPDGGSTSPMGTNLWTDASSISISAMPSSGYLFSQWSSNTSLVTFLNPTSSSTMANVNGTGTINAHYEVQPTPTPTPTPQPTTKPSPTPKPKATPTPTPSPSSSPNPSPSASPPIPELPSTYLLIILATATSLTIFYKKRGYNQTVKSILI